MITPHTNLTKIFKTFIFDYIVEQQIIYKGLILFLFKIFTYLYLFLLSFCYCHCSGFPCGSSGKESTHNAGDLGSIPRLGKSPGEGNGNPLQYPCLEKPTEEPGGLQSMGSQRVVHDWRSVLGVDWKDSCWSWNSSILATSCEGLTHWKRPWCWERLGAGGEGDDRGWDSWMVSPTWCTWVWVNSGSWW